MVIFNKQDFINKAKNVLEQQDREPYHQIPPKSKRKLLNPLTCTKADGCSGSSTYRKMYLMAMGPSSYMDYLKSNKGHPLKTHSVLQRCSLIWDGKGTCKNHVQSVPSNKVHIVED